MRLEDLLVSEGVAAPPDQIRRAMDSAEEAGRHPIAALVEEGIVVEDVLAEVLARAAATVVVDLEGAEPDDEAAALLGATIARQRLLIPISPRANGKVRVAFVNPLDEAAVAAARELIDHPIQRLTGTLSGVRALVEQTYASRTTSVLRTRATAELPPEDTRRLQSPGGANAHKDTSPLHRLEVGATLAQRHEALVLALIERGLVTRVDYIEALKRLLDEPDDG